jgi:hypothetical protein
MLNRFKIIILYSVFSLLIMCPATSFAWLSHGLDGDWDYHGSGRDHPYSDYIDRYNYIGYADYSPLEPDFVDGSYYIKNVTAPAILPLPAQITQVPALPADQPDEFTVNIPNDHGGYTAVVIKRSGNGFTGPQGEFYPAFPKVSQLRIMYGK